MNYQTAIQQKKVEISRNHSDLCGKIDIINKDIIKDISSIRDEIIDRLDVMSLLEYYGMSCFQSSGNSLRCPCPVHKGKDNNFVVKFIDSFGAPTFRWRCYSHLCENEYGGDIFGFIQAMENCSFYESVKFMMNFVGINESDIFSTNNGERIKSRNELTKICSEIEKLNCSKSDIIKSKNPFLNEDFVRRSLERRNSYFKNRGFSDNVLDIFEVGHCAPPDSAWSYAKCGVRAVIPIRDENMKLVGISGRAEVEKVEEGDSKYRILSGSDKEGTLYGLCYSYPYILEKGRVIIVEGFADLWKCWMSGHKNVVAVMGKAITDRQLIKLVKYAKSALLCFDYDNGKNEENVIELRNRLSLFMSANVAFISENNDIGGSSVDDVNKFFEKYKRFI